LNTFRQLGIALGVAVFGAVFQNRVDAHPSDLRAGYANGLDAALWLAAVLAVLAAVLVLGFVRPTKDNPTPDNHHTAEPTVRGHFESRLRGRAARQG
jgi:hypothetical protein